MFNPTFTFKSNVLLNEHCQVLGNAVFSQTLVGNNIEAITFNGNGDALSSLNAANVTTGTLVVARGGTGTTTSTGTGSVVLNTAPIISDTLRADFFSGSGAGLTDLNAANVMSGVLPSERLAGVSGAGLTTLNAANVTTGTLGVARGGTGTATSTGSGSVVLSTAPTISGTLTATSFLGNGAALNSLNAANVTTGTLAVVHGGTGTTTSTGTGSVVLNTAPAISGTLTATSFSGSGAGLTTLNAANITTGALAVVRGGTGTSTGLEVLDASNLTSGRVPDARLIGNYTQLGIVTATAFEGSGAEVTSLNANYVTTGTLPVTRGGTGATSLASSKLLVGNGTGPIVSSTKLNWDDAGSTLTIAGNINAVGFNSFATGGGILTDLDASKLTMGTVPDGRLNGDYSGVGTLTATSFYGDGAGLTNLNASALASGTVPNDRLSGDYSGLGTMTATAFTASTMTATAFVGSGAAVTSLNANNVTTGTLSVTRGGTGATSLVSSKLLVGNGIGPIVSSAKLNWDDAGSTLTITGNVNATSFNSTVSGGTILTDLDASNLTMGTVPDGRLNGDYSGVGTLTATSFYGDGAGLTNLNASALASGTVPNGRLSGDYSGLGTVIATAFLGDGSGVTRLNADAITLGTLAVTRGGTGTTSSTGTGSFVLNTNPTFVGTVTGGTFSGTHVGSGAGLTTLNAANVTTGTMLVARGGTGTTTSTGTGSVVLNTDPTFVGTATGGTFLGTHMGSGAGLTDLNAANVTTGTLAVARGGTGTTTSTGTGSVVLNTDPTFSGTVTGGTFSGTHTGSGAGLTTLNASNITTGTLTNLNYSGNLTPSGTRAVIVVQGEQDGGTGRGIYMWQSGDDKWGIYMAQSGAGRSLMGGTAVAAADFTGYAIRFRVQEGGGCFVWEDSGDNRLMSLGPSGALTATSFSGTHMGSGAGLTNLNAANITGTFSSGLTGASLTIQSSSPTITFSDTTSSEKTGYLHVNGNSMYVLTGLFGTGQWDTLRPLTVNLLNGNVTFGNTVTASSFSGVSASLTGTVTGGTFSGSGASLTNVPAGALTGTLNVARIGTNSIDINGKTTGTLAVARGGTGVTGSTGSGNNVLSISPTLSGTVTGGTFSGTHTGVGTNLTNLSASNIDHGTLNEARLPTSLLRTPYTIGAIASTTTIALTLRNKNASGGQMMFTGESTYTFSGQPGNTIWRFNANGSADNARNSWGGMSDERLKTNIVDARNYLDDLCRVRVRKYAWKAQQDTMMLGVVAQELLEVFPGLVSGDPTEELEDNSSNALAVKTSVFIPMLVKAVQELNVKTVALQDRVGSLETLLEEQVARNNMLESRMAALEEKI